ncbi:MAG: alpha/beta hydrolase [Acetobacteraceae bacterium]
MALKQPIEPCGVAGVQLIQAQEDFSKSETLKLLRSSLKDQLRQPNVGNFNGFDDKKAFTHVLIIVMGWNTVQAEAVQNENQITSNLARAAAAKRQPFRPLVIGVTWPSQWAVGDGWPISAQLVRGMSFWAKKDQADDVGRRFLTPIVKDVVLEAIRDSGTNVPVVMIGHSFGARAFSAMFRDWETVWRGKTPWDKDWGYTAPRPDEWKFRVGDRLILLEGAFDIRELFDEQKHLLPVLASRTLRVTMTSSVFDTATSTAIWGYYAGDRRTYAAVCSERKGAFGSYSTDEFQCGDATGNARATPITPDAPREWGLEVCSKMPEELMIDTPANQNPDRIIHYLDASKLINCQTPFGGGGAHSDFDRLEMGRFLWNEIQSSSPVQSAL